MNGNLDSISYDLLTMSISVTPSTAVVERGMDAEIAEENQKMPETKRPRVKRSKEATARRNQKTQAKNKAKNVAANHSAPRSSGAQWSSSAPTTTHKPSRTRTPGPSFNVRVTLNSGAPTEEVRRDLMRYLALRIAEMPSTSTSVPISLRDSRILGDQIVLVCDDRDSQGVVTELLGDREELRVVTGSTWRRYAFGGPGYLTYLNGGQIVQFLQRQNPDLPANSLNFVSINKGGRYQTVYVDVNEAGHTYLSGNGYKLKTMTTAVTLRPANGSSQRTNN